MPVPATTPSFEDEALIGSRTPSHRDTTTARTLARVEWLALASILLGSVGQLTLKAALRLLAPGTAEVWRLSPALACFLGVAAGLAIYAIGTWFWLKAVARASISYLYPLSACSYALVALGGQAFFGESISTLRWAGIAVITGGVALLAFTGTRSTQ